VVYSKTKAGPLRAYRMALGGVHGNAPWAGGDGGYECRKN
jgi:hypothetical protein